MKALTEWGTKATPSWLMVQIESCNHWLQISTYALVSIGWNEFVSALKEHNYSDNDLTNAAYNSGHEIIT